VGHHSGSTEPVLLELVQHRAVQDSGSMDSAAAAAAAAAAAEDPAPPLRLSALPPGLRDWALPRSDIEYMLRSDGTPLSLGEGARWVACVWGCRGACVAVCFAVWHGNWGWGWGWGWVYVQHSRGGAHAQECQLPCHLRPSVSSHCLLIAPSLACCCYLSKTSTIDQHNERKGCYTLGHFGSLKQTNRMMNMRLPLLLLPPPSLQWSRLQSAVEWGGGGCQGNGYWQEPGDATRVCDGEGLAASRGVGCVAWQVQAGRCRQVQACRQAGRTCTTGRAAS
jgi:hypothetical protein